LNGSKSTIKARFSQENQHLVPKLLNILYHTKFLEMNVLRITILLLFSLPLFSQEIDLKDLEGMKMRNIGPAGMSGRVTTIDVNLSNPAEIFVGTASGGVWKSGSGGIDWEPIFDEQPVQAIGALAINQLNPSEIWVGTGEGNPRNSHNSGEGIFKSLDGGKTWTCMGLEKTRLIHRVIIHRDNPDIVYVGVLGSAWGPSEERGVYKTTDGGKTWKKMLYINEETGVADLVVDPTNPNKLIAAMWEFGRKPWTFNSGGKGSGIHISYDGGESWKKITEEDGLPKGNLGRIGLAIAPSKPNIVYALVEAKKNGLYKSTDGGLKWKKIADKNIGNRPFYYADIFVDPQNENRIFNLHSYVTISEDGGKTFSPLLPYRSYSGVHPDHHAFWIHPTNPDFVIEGNDGGLNISHDRGKTWRFVENLPLAQFYHINYDMDVPYHVFGGMQDNGSWIGPSSIWKRGGIKNEDWQEVYFGDGFDVMLRRDNNRYGWAMSQGGNLGYFDRETGKTKFVKPLHPDGTELRFHWNAGLAQNPFHDCGIYYGSQFLHKSMDCGESWEIISPDLTTNDPKKQKQAESGGLTLDVTQAENHTTILAIAPSPVDEQVIWVGTDDGNLQLTKDGGRNWTNFADQLPGCPKGSWIPQIEVSLKNAGEAFVIVNNYRRNDYTPYAYHTKDFGKTWKRIVNEEKVKGHTLSIVQDPEEPRLLFLGTDYGLYVSFNEGESWQQWMKGFPSVSTRDLKIHPREHDLIVGTFGRSAWILDDIRPLREIARTQGKVLEKDFAVFPAPDAYHANYRSVEGSRFIADAVFVGDNKGSNAILRVWVKKKDKEEEEEEEKNEKEEDEAAEEEEVMAASTTDTLETADQGEKIPKGKVKVEVYDAEGNLLLTYYRKVKEGMNRIFWNLRQKGVRYPSWSTPKKDEPLDDPSGYRVMPGTYKLVLAYADEKDSTLVTVKEDPRAPMSASDREAMNQAYEEFYQMVEKARKGFDQLKEAKATIKRVNELLIHVPDSTKKAIVKQGKTVQDSLQKVMELYRMPQNTKGIVRTSDKLTSYLSRASGYIGASDGPPGQMAQFAKRDAEKKLAEVLQATNEILSGDWKKYQEAVEAIEFSVFKSFEQIE
jgi:photosystem II stability/assembly factor-like uncharacterized protein